jgi:hypothetical protein
MHVIACDPIECERTSQCRSRSAASSSHRKYLLLRGALAVF